MHRDQDPPSELEKSVLSPSIIPKKRRYLTRKYREAIHRAIKYIRNGKKFESTGSNTKDFINKAKYYVGRELMLYPITFYAGDLVRKRQETITSYLGLSPAALSKRSATAIYTTFALPQLATIMGISELPESTWVADLLHVGVKPAMQANLLIGGAIDLVRGYYAFVRERPTPAISLKSIVINGLDKSIQKARKNPKTLNSG